MQSILVPALILSLVAFVGMLGLRTFSYRTRIAFDVVCFTAISLSFFLAGMMPVFPPLGREITPAAVLWRLAGSAWWLLGARILVAAVWGVFSRDERSREARLFFDLVTAAIYLAAGGAMLNSVFALPVTGIIATSGAIAIVLGLALQSTLADVFSGIAVGIEAPFRVGDRVRIGVGGDEYADGEVLQINWRSTRILTDSNDVAVLPNSLVAKARILNHSVPAPIRTLSVTLPVDSGAVPERVIETLGEAMQLLPEILPLPTPRAMLSSIGLGESAYTATFAVDADVRLDVVRDRFLRGARRQFAGMRFPGSNRSSSPGSEAVGALFRELVIFESLDDSQVESLAGAAEPIALEPGATLFRQDEADGALYVLGAGILEVRRRSDRGSQLLGCIGAGDYIGEIGLLTGAPHPATATARSNVTAFRLPASAMAPLVKANGGILAALERSVRRGLEILDREAAARVAAEDARGPLLVRIRNFCGIAG